MLITLAATTIRLVTTTRTIITTIRTPMGIRIAMVRNAARANRCKRQPRIPIAWPPPVFRPATR